jgi:hypothetical protein
MVVRRLGDGGRVKFGFCCIVYFEMDNGRVRDVVDVGIHLFRIVACEWDGSWLEKEDVLSLPLPPKSFLHTQSRLDGYVQTAVTVPIPPNHQVLVTLFSISPRPSNRPPNVSIIIDARILAYYTSHQPQLQYSLQNHTCLAHQALTHRSTDPPRNTSSHSQHSVSSTPSAF